MTVATCRRCGIFISVSWIPGGNPVALEDPEHWATAYRPCEVCGQLYCGQCSSIEPLCPECPGPPQPAPRSAQIASIRRICRDKENYTGIGILSALWGFTTPNQTIEDKIEALRKTFSLSEMQTLSEA